MYVSLPPQGTVGFVKFDIKDINSAACADPSESIKEVAQVAMMGFREVVIAGGYVNKVTPAYYVLRLAQSVLPHTEATTAHASELCFKLSVVVFKQRTRKTKDTSYNNLTAKFLSGLVLRLWARNRT